MKTNHKRTAEWLAACGKKPGDEAALAVQVGCHLEEICEQLDELIVAGSSADNDSIELASTRIKGLAHRLKQGKTGIRIKSRVNFLDALCDVDVTGNGVAFLAGLNKEEADKRVLDSNDAKLVNGKPVLAPGGKIQKPEGWLPPKLHDLV